jgi:hypothetical protein
MVKPSLCGPPRQSKQAGGVSRYWRSIQSATIASTSGSRGGRRSCSARFTRSSGAPHDAAQSCRFYIVRATRASTVATAGDSSPAGGTGNDQGLRAWVGKPCAVTLRSQRFTRGPMMHLKSRPLLKTDPEPTRDSVGVVAVPPQLSIIADVSRDTRGPLYRQSSVNYRAVVPQVWTEYRRRWAGYID